jgi:hypothetical protein
MKHTRGITAAAAAAMTAAGVLTTPATAHAAPVLPLNGTFKVETDGSCPEPSVSCKPGRPSSGTWAITSTCSSADSCVAQVRTEKWPATAQSTENGMWHMAVDIPDGITCTEGTGMAQVAKTGPLHQEYFWNQFTDNATEASGWFDSSWPACGDNPGGSYTKNFTMTKVS